MGAWRDDDVLQKLFGSAFRYFLPPMITDLLMPFLCSLSLSLGDHCVLDRLMADASVVVGIVNAFTTHG